MSTVPRISFLGANRTAQLRLRQAYARLDATNQQVATGRAFARPSANAPAASRAAVVQNQLDQLESFDRAIDDSRARLSVTDAKISQAVDVYQRISQLAVQASNGINGPESLKAIREEIVQMRGELQAIGNSDYLGSPLFGGLGTASPITYNSGTSTWNFAGARRRSPNARSARTRRSTSRPPPANCSATPRATSSRCSTSWRPICSPAQPRHPELDRQGQLAAFLPDGRPGTYRCGGQPRRAGLDAQRGIEGDVRIRVVQPSGRGHGRRADRSEPVVGAYQAALGVTAKATERTLLDWLR